MADTDLQATFSANINPLKTNVAQAQDAVQSFATATQTGAARASVALRDLTVASKNASDAMITGMSESGREAMGLGTALGGIGTAGESGFNTVSIRGRDVRNMLRSLTGGVEETTASLQSMGTNLATRFIAANAALIPVAAAVAAIGGAFAYMIVRAIDAKNALDAVATSVRLGGVTDITTQEMAAMTAQLEKVSGVSYKMAGDVVASFANMSGASKPLMQSLTAATIDFAAASGGDVPKAADKLRTAFSDPAAGAKLLRDSIHAITPEQIAMVEQMDRTGTRTQAQAALLDVLNKAMQADITAHRADLSARLENAYAMEAESGALPILTSRLEAQIAALDKRTEALKRSTEATRSQPIAAPANVSTAADVNLGPQEQALERVNTQIARLRETQRALGEEFANTEVGTERYRELYAQLTNVGANLRAAREQQQSLDEALGNTTSQDVRLRMLQQTATLAHTSRIDELKESIEIAEQMKQVHAGDAKVERDQDMMIAGFRIEMEKETTAVAVAEANLRKTNAEGNSQAVLSAELSRIAAARKGVREHSAESIALDNEEAQAKSRAEDAKTALEQQGVDSRHTIAINEVAAREQLLKEQGNSGLISRQAELAGLREANDQRTAIDREYYTTLAEMHKDDEKEYAGYQHRLVEVASESALRRANIERQVGTQITNEWTSHFTQVGSSVSSAVMGMIRGTTTLRGAFQSVALDIVNQFVSAGAKMIAQDAAVVAARLLGIETVKGAETAGVAGSILTRIAEAMSKIGAGVGETIAGVTANQAPIAGPLAVGEGVAAGAAVAAAATGAVFAETGIWQTGGGLTPAVLHPGEMVLPGPSADQMRDALGGGGGGGGDIHVHISAIDGHSVRRLFQNNGMEMARVLRDVWQNNRSTRPAY